MKARTYTFALAIAAVVVWILAGVIAFAQASGGSLYPGAQTTTSRNLMVLPAPSGQSVLQINADGSNSYLTSAGLGNWLGVSTQYPVWKYGAVADGKIIYDATFSNGATNLSSSTANFTSADQGKVIVLQLSPTSRQVTTIASVTNSTTVVLSNAATGANDKLAAEGVQFSSGVQPANNDTVTVAATTYKFVTSLSGAANEILIGANVQATLTNEVSAINATSGAGSTYGTGTAQNANVSAVGPNNVNQIALNARTAGSAGNSLTISATGATLTFSNTTLLGGADGSICYYGTDNTAAIQNAINAADAAGGGIVRFESGIYLVTGAVTGNTTGGNNSVLTIPPHYQPSPQTFMVLEGVAPSRFYAWGLSVGYNVPNGQQLDTTGTVIYCPTTATAGAPGAYPAFLSSVRYDLAQGSLANFTTTTVQIKNLAIVLKANPTLTAIQARRIGSLDVSNVCIGVDYWWGRMPDPTSGLAYGIYGPGNSNDNRQTYSNVYVSGFNTGIEAGEHTWADNLHLHMCIYGLSFSLAGHPLLLGNLSFEECKYSISGESAIEAGSHTTSILMAAFEGVTDWKYYGYDLTWMHATNFIYDPNTRFPAGSSITYKVGMSGLGARPATLSGGTGLTLVNAESGSRTIVNGDGSVPAISVCNTNTSASEVLAMLDSTGTKRAGVGFGNSGMAAPYAGRVYFYSTGTVPFMFANGSTAYWLVEPGNSGLCSASGPIRPASYVVSGLPGASAMGAGSTAFVTDANSPTYGTTVSGGGASKAFVVSDGTSWIVH